MLHNNGNVGAGARNNRSVTVHNTIVVTHNLGLYNHAGHST